MRRERERGREREYVESGPTKFYYYKSTKEFSADYAGKLHIRTFLIDTTLGCNRGVLLMRVSRCIT